jgi:hypothetical protein
VEAVQLTKTRQVMVELAVVVVLVQEILELLVQEVQA